MGWETGIKLMIIRLQIGQRNHSAKPAATKSKNKTTSPIKKGKYYARMTHELPRIGDLIPSTTFVPSAVLFFCVYGSIAINNES